MTGYSTDAQAVRLEKKLKKDYPVIQPVVVAQSVVGLDDGTMTVLSAVDPEFEVSFSAAGTLDELVLRFKNESGL